MQHNALVGRLITQPVVVVKDDTRFCRFTVAELRKRSGNQTKIEFTAFDAVASHIADKPGRRYRFHQFHHHQCCL